jgi:predicted ribosome quality control (RQC) complex YloA/Tae2 family protein
VHNNYYFLRHLTKAIEPIITDAVISECFSQNKEELIIRFETRSDPFFIKASLHTTFTCLAFPMQFHRAKKNSIDLFEILIGQRVQSVTQFNNERSFALRLSNNLTLLFKMHGNRSNIILFENEKILTLFKKNIPTDHQLDLSSLNREIDWSYENFITHRNEPAKIYFTFGKLIWQYLDLLDYKIKDIEQQWQMINDVKKELDTANFYVSEWKDIPVLSLIKTGLIKRHFTDPVKAINEFYFTFTQVFVLTQEKREILSALNSKLQSYENYIKKTKDKLTELEQGNNYKVWADLIMANMHHVEPGSEKVLLNDFYDEDKPVEIKLKKDFSAQKNAEVYYKKSKNQNIELGHLRDALTQKQKAIDEVTAQLLTLQGVSDLKTLRQVSATFQHDVKESAEGKVLPYHEFIVNGFKIWVGRNAQSNDILTLKFGYKEDLWLHAKDVAGSHVIIKHQAGKNFPKDVIERAAQLAAYNSKRKNETLCPVIVTPKKFVRKRKGDPAGAVIVEREDVMMVEPKL